MQKTDERQIKTAMLEIHQKMVEEIKHIIVEASRIGM